MVTVLSSRASDIPSIFKELTEEFFTNEHTRPSSDRGVFDKFLSNVFCDSIRETYPPKNYKIKKENDSTILLLEYALAGFSESDLSVSLKENILSVSGDISESESDEWEYLSRGISGRNFSHTYRLPANTEVDEVTFDAGILSIRLVQRVREEDKPRVIPINTKRISEKNEELS